MANPQPAHFQHTHFGVNAHLPRRCVCIGDLVWVQDQHEVFYADYERFLVQNPDQLCTFFEFLQNEQGHDMGLIINVRIESTKSDKIDEKRGYDPYPAGRDAAVFIPNNETFGFPYFNKFPTTQARYFVAPIRAIAGRLETNASQLTEQNYGRFAKPSGDPAVPFWIAREEEPARKSQPPFRNEDVGPPSH